MPFSPNRSGLILNRYASNPPTLSIVLKAPVVTLSANLRPSASEYTCLLWTLGNQVRRVLLLKVSPTAFPDWIERPSYRPVCNRLAFRADRDVARSRGSVGNMVTRAKCEGSNGRTAVRLKLQRAVRESPRDVYTELASDVSPPE